MLVNLFKKYENFSYFNIAVIGEDIQQGSLFLKHYLQSNKSTNIKIKIQQNDQIIQILIAICLEKNFKKSRRNLIYNLLNKIMNYDISCIHISENIAIKINDCHFESKQTKCNKIVNLIEQVQIYIEQCKQQEIQLEDIQTQIDQMLTNLQYLKFCLKMLTEIKLQKLNNNNKGIQIQIKNLPQIIKFCNKFGINEKLMIKCILFEAFDLQNKIIKPYNKIENCEQNIYSSINALEKYFYEIFGKMISNFLFSKVNHSNYVISLCKFENFESIVDEESKQFKNNSVIRLLLSHIKLNNIMAQQYIEQKQYYPIYVHKVSKQQRENIDESIIQNNYFHHKIICKQFNCQTLLRFVFQKYIKLKNFEQKQQKRIKLKAFQSINLQKIIKKEFVHKILEQMETKIDLIESERKKKSIIQKYIKSALVFKKIFLIRKKFSCHIIEKYFRSLPALKIFNAKIEQKIKKITHVQKYIRSYLLIKNKKKQNLQEFLAHISDHNQQEGQQHLEILNSLLNKNRHLNQFYKKTFIEIEVITINNLAMTQLFSNSNLELFFKNILTDMKPDEKIQKIEIEETLLSIRTNKKIIDYGIKYQNKELYTQNNNHAFKNIDLNSRNQNYYQQFKSIQNSIPPLFSNSFNSIQQKSVSSSFNNHHQFNPLLKQNLEFGLKIKILKISYGLNYMICLAADKTLYSCGENKFGQLGLGDYIPRIKLQKISNLQNIIKISCGIKQSICLNNRGNVFAWGYIKNHEIQKKDYVNTPKLQKLPEGNIIDVESTNYNSFALYDNKRIYDINNLNLCFRQQNSSLVPFQIVCVKSKTLQILMVKKFNFINVNISLKQRKEILKTLSVTNIGNKKQYLFRVPYNRNQKHANLFMYEQNLNSKYNTKDEFQMLNQTDLLKRPQSIFEQSQQLDLTFNIAK